MNKSESPVSAATPPNKWQDWQRRVNACPAVFMVEDTDGFITNVYDTKEAAEVEIAFAARHGRTYHIRQEPMQTEALARERYE